jgi:hypothetical protein
MESTAAEAAPSDLRESSDSPIRREELEETMIRDFAYDTKNPLHWGKPRGRDDSPIRKPTVLRRSSRAAADGMPPPPHLKNGAAKHKEEKGDSSNNLIMIVDFR